MKAILQNHPRKMKNLLEQFALSYSIVDKWRPLSKAHFDIEPLFGVTNESKRLKMLIVFGWNF